MSSLFEQWKADHTALTLESWLVKRILEWQDSKDGMIQDSIEQSDRLTCKIDELEARLEWKTVPENINDYPDGTILIQVDLSSGQSDTALVYIDDEDWDTLHYSDQYGDVYTDWQFSDVSRYLELKNLLPAALGEKE